MVYYQQADFSPDTSVGYLAKRVVQASRNGLEPAFAEEGLSYLQWSAMVSIWLERGTSCAALARDLGHDSGATTRLVDGLATRGLVERVRDSDDRRVVNLTLTEEGVAVTERCRVRVTAHWNGWLEGWDAADVDRLIGYLQRLRGDVERATGQGSRP